MTDGNRQPSDGESTPVTRRGFLLATGAAGAGVATQFEAARADPVPAGALAVEGSRRHRALSREVAATLRDVDLAVLSSGTNAGFRRFAAGEVDAHVAGRPMGPAEREAAADAGIAFERVELALGAAALVHPERAWYDCLSASRLAEAWDGAADAASYAEVAGDVPASAAPAGAETRSARDLREVLPGIGATVVVRGTREFQYEEGFGGVGYYEPGPERIRPLAAVRREDIESYTPLVRLAYVYLNEESLGTDAGRVARAYRDRAARRTGEVTFFADPD